VISLTVHPDNMEVRPSDDKGRTVCIELSAFPNDVRVYLNRQEAFQLLDGLVAAIPHLKWFGDGSSEISLRLESFREPCPCGGNHPPCCTANPPRAATPVQRETNET
jgi:hypothetical protein